MLSNDKKYLFFSKKKTLIKSGETNSITVNFGTKNILWQETQKAIKLSH